MQHWPGEVLSLREIFLRRHPDCARTIVLNAASPIFEGGGDIVTRFVETASVENLDTSCVEARPPTDFGLSGSED